MLDQFVSERVLIPDSSCDFACPVVIVNKQDGGICMNDDYREVNMQLESTANQLPHQPILFQRLGIYSFMLRWIICGEITNYVLLRTGPRLGLVNLRNVVFLQNTLILSLDILALNALWRPHLLGGHGQAGMRRVVTDDSECSICQKLKCQRESIGRTQWTIIHVIWILLPPYLWICWVLIVDNYSKLVGAKHDVKGVRSCTFTMGVKFRSS